MAHETLSVARIGSQLLHMRVAVISLRGELLTLYVAKWRRVEVEALPVARQDMPEGVDEQLYQMSVVLAFLLLRIQTAWIFVFTIGCLVKRLETMICHARGYFLQRSDG